jgi:hypothetical protein
VAAFGPQPIAGVADLRVLPKQVVGPDGATITYGDNGMASHAYNFVMGLLPFFYSGIRLVIDRDKAKIPWRVDGRSQAQRTRFTWAEVVAGELVEVKPQIAETDPKPALLQVADLYAYAIAQASLHKGGERERWFRKLVQESIRPQLLQVPPFPQSPAAWVRGGSSPR